ncbi:hypothetical protein STEG23_005313 [Scotinomys teguina]
MNGRGRMSVWTEARTLLKGFGPGSSLPFHFILQIHKVEVVKQLRFYRRYLAVCFLFLKPYVTVGRNSCSTVHVDMLTKCCVGRVVCARASSRPVYFRILQSSPVPVDCPPAAVVSEQDHPDSRGSFKEEKSPESWRGSPKGLAFSGCWSSMRGVFRSGISCTAHLRGESR